MNWKSSLILAVGMVAAALIYEGKQYANAQSGGFGTKLFLGESNVNYIWHAHGSSVRFCKVKPTDKLEIACSDWQ